MHKTEFPALNLPAYPIKLQFAEEHPRVFDPVRKKWIALTPEEWVRQHFIQYLIHDLNYPLSLMAVEMGFKLNRLTKRGDIVVYNRKAQPVLIVECKAPDVAVNQKVVDQIVRYNMELKVKFLIITNGMKHFGCYVDYENQSFRFLKSLPQFEQLQ